MHIHTPVRSTMQCYGSPRRKPDGGAVLCARNSCLRAIAEHVNADYRAVCECTVILGYVTSVELTFLDALVEWSRWGRHFYDFYVRFCLILHVFE